jgi:hypothetical protein
MNPIKIIKSGGDRVPIIFLAFILFLFAQPMGCGPINPAPRDQLVKNLGPMRQIEERASRMTIVYQNLALAGWTSKVDEMNFREHYDLYYIYHKAATVSLAQGDIEAYNAYLQSAKKELDGLETDMKGLVDLRPD